VLGNERFDEWGWRIPFLLSVVLLGVSVWIRLRLSESPLFQEMKAQGKMSKAPLTESFGRWSNARVVLLALFGLTAGQAVVWYWPPRSASLPMGSTTEGREPCGGRSAERSERLSVTRDGVVGASRGSPAAHPPSPRVPERRSRRGGKSERGVQAAERRRAGAQALGRRAHAALRTRGPARRTRDWRSSRSSVSFPSTTYSCTCSRTYSRWRM
jgi:hypothetical protein